METGEFVYIFRMGDFFKIGKSKEPERRLMDIDGTKLPIKPILVATVYSENPFYLENLIQKEIKEYRVRGEWFRLGSVQVKQIIDKYKFNVSHDIFKRTYIEPAKVIKIISKGVLDRRSVSGLYSGEVKELLIKIERLTAQIAKNTSYKPTIVKAGERYDNAVLIASNNNLDKIMQLKGILSKLKYSKLMQDNRHIQNKKENILKKEKVLNKKKSTFSIFGLNVSIR